VHGGRRAEALRACCGRASGIWGCGMEGGGSGAEVGGGINGGGDAEVGQPDGAKPNFTMIRVLRRWGYSPYTRYYWYRLT
jgi:hypothetical protein